MALNPRGTRQRDGAAQLAQFQKENRLFDETSSSGVSPVFEVWNEPVVIHVHNLAPGQGVAVDCVSDYDSNPVYTPFTPVRGTPLILDEDLTSVILFYSGRYVLRLTGGGLGTIKAFCYPFSVSHDWGDYYASLGTGGNVVRSLDEIDTNTINITLNPDPGIGDVTIRADAVLSPDPRNILEFRVNGMYARGPNNGNIEDAIVGANDTNTIDHTVTANILTSQVIRSPDANQILELRVNGVYVPGPQNGNPANVPTSVLDTQSVDLTLAANVLSADVIISPDGGNSLEIRANGLYATGFAGTITTASDTNTIDHSVAMGVLSSQVIRSPDAGNLIELRANGVYSGVGNAVTSVTDTQSIDLTLAANNLQADLRIDPSAENVLNVAAPGVLVEAANTSEIELETAGDLVVTAAGLGHIVNARASTQSAHLGVNAGSLQTNQIAIGFNAGTGVSGLGNISIGTNSGQNVTSSSNIYIGDSVGPGAGTGNAGRNNVLRIATEGTSGASRFNDFTTIIGAAYRNHTNVISLNPSPYATVVGHSAADAINFSNQQQSFPINAFGSWAGRNVVLQGGGGITAVGPDAGSAAKAGSLVAVGVNAGSSAFASYTGVAPSIDCFGFAAGANIYNTVFNAQIVSVLCVGLGAGANAVYPSKNYVMDASKFPVVPAIETEITFAETGHSIKFSTEGQTDGRVEAVDPTRAFTLNMGWSAGNTAHLLSNLSIGDSATFAGYSADSVAIGPYAGSFGGQEESINIGYASGQAASSVKSVFIGSQSGAGTVGSPISANFTGTAFNGTNTITTPTHTLAVGEYHTIQFDVVSGSPPSNMPDGTTFTVFAQSNTTLIAIATSPAAGGVGTYRFIEILKRENCVAIGYQATNDKSHQVTLGNTLTEDVRTAGKVYPGHPIGAFQNNAGLYGGVGAPDNADGSDGDFYFRSDGGAGTSIYHKRAGAWVGIV